MGRGGFIFKTLLLFLASYFLGVHCDSPLILLFYTGCIGALTYFLFKREFFLQHFILLLGGCCWIVFFSYINHHSLTTVPYGYHSNISVDITDAPQFNYQRYKSKIYIKSLDFKAIAYFPKGQVIHYKDQCIVSGSLESVDPPRNPGDFDYQRFLQRQDIVGRFYVQSVDNCVSSSSWDFKRVSYRIRDYVHQSIRNQLDPPYSELFIGLIFGQFGVELPESFTSRFRTAGLTHLLVVSGSQISLISGILLAILRVLKAKKLVVFSVMILVHSMFYIITGGGASIFRAIVMFDFMLLVSFMKRNPHSVHVAILTLLGMMVMNPLIIEDLGAQLSFLATFSLIAVAPIIRDRLSERFSETIREMISVSLAPFIMTTPLIWYSFHLISPYSVFANAALMFLVEWLVVLGFFTTVLAVVMPILASPYFALCYFVMLIIDSVAVLVQSLPFSTVYIPSPPVWVLCVYYLSFLRWCYSDFISVSTYINSFFRFRSLIVLLMVCYLWWRFVPIPLQVWFLDVGQGDCILIRTPGRKHILIDAGVKQYDYLTGEVKKDMGQRVVVPVLRYLGVSHLDLVIVSHMDMDHVGGLPTVLKHFSVGLVLDDGLFKKYSEYSKTIRQLSLNRETVRRDDRIELEKDLSMFFLHPPVDLEGLSKNDRSLSFILQYKEARFLFTGDLESSQEQVLVDRYSEFLDVDVLKVGHHGSKTSSTVPFLKASTPSVAIIQCGKRNRYGHPNSKILERFEYFSTTIFRNDFQGAIFLETNGDWIRVSPTIIN